MLDIDTGPFMCRLNTPALRPLIDNSASPDVGWHCIRQAWPQYHIPHPDHLAQQTRRILTAQSAKNNNSLAATNAARNLLL